MQSFFLPLNNQAKVQFTKTLTTYCAAQNYHDMALSEAEVDQLYLHQKNPKDNLTPQATTEQKQAEIDYEIKRSLARRYQFELLLRGDEKAYLEFIAEQKDNDKLSLVSFKNLAEEVKALDEDLKTVIKASCFLVIPDSAKIILQNKNLPKDSEQFQSHLACLLQQEPNLYPIPATLSKKQLAILPKMYFPMLHFRHILYTEGGDNMVATLRAAIKSGEFTERDFAAWRWRWLTNIFGMQSTSIHARDCFTQFYTQSAHDLTHGLFTELKKLLSDPDFAYLENYLQKRADLAGFRAPALTKSEQQLLAHLAAHFNRVTILKSEGEAMMQGYRAFKKEFSNDLANYYQDYKKTVAMTPTYFPAILNNAYYYFKKELQQSDFDAIKMATQFMCQVLNDLYAYHFQQVISAKQLAADNHLYPILKIWTQNHFHVEFKINDQNEVNAEQVMLRKTHRIQ